jgi:hypothetical protein
MSGDLPIAAPRLRQATNLGIPFSLLKQARRSKEWRAGANPRIRSMRRHQPVKLAPRQMLQTL